MNKEEFIKTYGQLWTASEIEFVDLHYNDFIDKMDEVVSGESKKVTLELHHHELATIPSDLSYESLILENCKNLQYLPSGLKVEFDCDLSGCSSLQTLPQGLEVRGTLNITDTTFNAFPSDIYVGGSLVACRSGLRSIPMVRKVSGNLILRDCLELEELPDELVVLGDLDLSDCPRLKSLPHKLVVTGNLLLQNSPINTISSKMVVGGSMDFYGSAITHLPDGLQVGGYLNLSHCCQLHQLPANLVVCNNLYLDGTSVSSLPADSRVLGIYVAPDGKSYVRNQDGWSELPRTEDPLSFLSKEAMLHNMDQKLEPLFMAGGTYVSVNQILYKVLFTKGNYILAQPPMGDELLCLVKDDGSYQMDTVFYSRFDDSYQTYLDML